MILRAYLKKHKIRPIQLARLVGIEPSLIYNALNDKRKLSRRSAEQIERFTNGQVSRFEAMWPEKFKENIDE